MIKMDTDIELKRRLPAEWEEHCGVILAWPHEDTDWNYMLDEVTECYVKIVEAIVETEIAVILAPDTELPKRYLGHLDQSRIIYFSVPTNDTWARDFGVITMTVNGSPVLCDFKFNGWGLKFAADKDNLITRRMTEAGLLKGRYENHLGFVLEGGSIESDGQGTLLTTSECLLSLNRNGNLSREQIEKYLSETFNVDNVLWLDHGALEGDDTDSHIDTLARLAPNDTIIYTGCDDETDSHFNELKAMEDELKQLKTRRGTPFNLIALPLPDPIYDEDGNRLPATYANFLITPDSVLLPVYGQPKKDFLASQIVRIAFPDHEVKAIDCRALIRQHGSLHCVTMQLPKDTLPI